MTPSLPLETKRCVVMRGPRFSIFLVSLHAIILAPCQPAGKPLPPRALYDRKNPTMPFGGRASTCSIFLLLSPEHSKDDLKCLCRTPFSQSVSR